MRNMSNNCRIWILGIDFGTIAIRRYILRNPLSPVDCKESMALPFAGPIGAHLNQSIKYRIFLIKQPIRIHLARNNAFIFAFTQTQEYQTTVGVYDIGNQKFDSTFSERKGSWPNCPSSPKEPCNAPNRPFPHHPECF